MEVGEHAEHVRSILIVGDPPEPLRLTLGAVHAAGLVEPFERRVLFRFDPGDHSHFTAFRQIEEGQALIIQRILVAAERPAVHRHRFQRQVLALQPERRRAVRPFELHCVFDPGFTAADFEAELGTPDPVSRRLIIREEYGLRRFLCIHSMVSLRRFFKVTISRTGPAVRRSPARPAVPRARPPRHSPHAL